MGKSIPFTRPMTEAAARKIANELSIQKKKQLPSYQWMAKNFRQRNNIQFDKLCGQSVDVDCQAVEHWKKTARTRGRI